MTKAGPGKAGERCDQDGDSLGSGRRQTANSTFSCQCPKLPACLSAKSVAKSGGRGANESRGSFCPPTYHKEPGFC